MEDNNKTRLTDIEQLEIIMSKLGEAHAMLAKTSLPKKEYQPVSSLLSLAKVELFNYYWNLKEAARL